MPKNYVLKSTQESRGNQITSILAIVETIFFTLLTWGVAIYYDTYTHIYTAIAIAPFLLLKTPESIDKAIEWFLYEPKIDEKTYYKEPYNWFVVSITALFISLISYFFSKKILVHDNGLAFFFVSIFISNIIIILGVGVGVAIVVIRAKAGALAIVSLALAGLGAVIGLGVTRGAIVVAIVAIVGGGGVAVVLTKNKIKDKVLKSLLALLFSPAIVTIGAIFGLIFLMKSIIIKIAITTFYALKHPLKTFFYISKNFREQIMVNDVFYSPELLPQLSKKDDSFQVLTILSQFRSNNLLDKLINLLVIPIWSLSYLYRFSIKTTSWFFFPLAYLANLEALQDEEKKKKAIKTQTWKNLFWFNTIIAAILFLYFKSIGQYIDLLGLSENKLNFIKDAMLRLQKYFIPEAMWLLVVAVGLYFVLNMFISRQEHLGENQYPMFTYWLIKLIAALWMIFLGWHLVVLVNHELMPVVKVWLGRT